MTRTQDASLRSEDTQAEAARHPRERREIEDSTRFTYGTLSHREDTATLRAILEVLLDIREMLIPLRARLR